MKGPRQRQGLKKLVEVNGRVSPGEQVIVITDATLEDLADEVASVAAARGGSVTIYSMSPRDHDGQEPPQAVAAAMLGADVIFSPVSRSITHTRAMRAALEHSARAILMTAYNDDVLGSAALLETDFEAQAGVCRRLGDIFTEGCAVRLTSPRGTDLRFSIEGRRANVLTNIPDPGQLAPVPDIEVNVVPAEQSAEGILVADASVPYLGIGVLEQPIECEVGGGFITGMAGGDQADTLREHLESHMDRNCFNVAELGVGLNPNARLTGNMLDDEGVLGTIHIGIGTSHTLGGAVVAPTHYDLLMWEPTIEVDGRIVQQNRDILV